MRPDQRETLLALYRPNVGRGNFQADVAGRGANRMLARVIVALGLASDSEVAAAFRERDAEHSQRSEAYLERLNAEQGR